MEKASDNICLGDIAEIIMGQSPPGETYNLEGKGLPFYQGVADFGYRYPKKRVFCSKPTRISEKGDILLSVRAPIGRVNRATEKCATGRGLAIIRVDDPFDQTFLEYELRAKFEEFKALEGQGSVFGNAKKSDLACLKIFWLEKAQRRSIAVILGSLDDQIEYHNQISNTLDTLIHTLFKSWFVDFDPVKKKIDAKTLNLDVDIANIFPTSFEQSVLGKIPKGWKVTTLKNEIEVVRGLSYTGSGLSDHGIPLHNLNSVLEGGGYKYEGIKYYIGDYKEHHLIKPGDVLVTNTEQGFDFLLIGFPAIIPKCYGNEGIFSHHIFRVRPLNTSYLSNYFIYCLLMTDYVREQIIACTNGTTVNMLSKDGLELPKFVLPSKEAVDAFTKIVSPMFQLIEQNHEESEIIASIRDTLLPKLISGEIKVPD